MKHITKFTEYLKEELISNPPANLHTELIKLVGDGNVDALDKFMDANDVDVNHDSGMILKLAAKLGKMDILKYLDEIGGDFSLRRNLIVKTALAFGQLEAAEFILNNLDLTSDQIDDIKEYVMESSSISVGEKRKATELLDKY